MTNGWDHERNDDGCAPTGWDHATTLRCARTVLARPTQRRPRAGRRGSRRRGHCERMGPRTQRRHPAPGPCSRDRPSPEREPPNGLPAARAWDHERNDDTQARTVLARSTQPRTRAGRTGSRRRGHDERRGSRTQRRRAAPGPCSRDRPSPEREPAEGLPAAREWRTEGITNATTTRRARTVLARSTQPRTRAGRTGSVGGGRWRAARDDGPRTPARPHGSLVIQVVGLVRRRQISIPRLCV